MKKLLFVIVFLLALFGLGYLNRDVVIAQTNRFVYQSPCESPKHYSIGKIDKEFDMSEAEFRQAVSEAAAIWNTAYGKQLFVYDPDAAFTVNLLYDNRQSLNTEIGELNNELEQEDSVLKPQIDEYNRKSADLERRIQELNQEIQSWNERGGAPKDVYDGLKTRQESLNAEARALNSEAERLSLSTKDLNSKIDHLNDTVQTFNNALNVKPEGGKYILDAEGERIVINIYDSHTELINVLAHEMGHSLGMGHVNNPNAIMYPESNDATAVTSDDTKQLVTACRKQNVVKLKFEQVSYSVHQLIRNRAGT